MVTKFAYMTYQDIETLITKKEGNSLEFKESTGQLDRSMETLCAFLNGEGGTILYGVRDDGRIIGQTVSDSTKRSIAEALNRIEPFVDLEITYITIPDTEKYVIVIFVEELSFLLWSTQLLEPEYVRPSRPVRISELIPSFS
jgi:ATP-dependent DNA helicase RecG